MYPLDTFVSQKIKLFRTNGRTDKGKSTPPPPSVWKGFIGKSLWFA